MSSLVPFTAYFRTIPARGDSKWDYIRSLQHFGIQLYDALELVDAITLSVPGGSQNQLSGQFGSIANGTGVRPQIGNNPSLLMIEGFYTASSNASDQPAPALTLIHCNEILTGPNGPRLWGGDTEYPTAAVISEVQILSGLLNTAALDITDEFGGHPELFKLTYKNIKWGDGGLTFPV
jgi:hypothetical protein